jgi:hypothetical protein
MKSHSCVLLWLLLLPCSIAAQQLSPTDQRVAQGAVKNIRAGEIRAHMRFLSDSLLQGRGTGTAGYQIAAHYVATELEGMGLQPGAKESWYQQVPLRKAVLDRTKSSVAILRNGKEETLADAKDYAMSGSVLRTESDVQAPVVFVGFGITAPEQKYDDYAKADVKGKIICTIYGAPPAFPSTVRAYYSDGVVKLRNAVTHGAVGLVTVLLPEDQKRYPWDWLVPQIQAGTMEWLDKEGKPHNSFPEIRGGALLNQAAAAQLFEGAPKSLEQAFTAARKSQAQSFPLPQSLHIHSVSTHTKADSPNIIAELRGSDPAVRDQYLVYTAHVDHLGLCPPVKGDNVCHGAVDNASGTATLLAIARAYSGLPRPPRRSVLFVFVTGEEMGLLGSDYFAYFPTVPLKSIVANINIDGAPGLYFPMKDVVALGAEHSSMDADVQRAAQTVGYKLSPDPMPEEVAFIRSDQYSFVQQGVPAVDVEDGTNSSDPRVNGMEVIKKWLTTKYHTPLDNMDQPLNYDSAAKGANMNFLIGYEIAQQASAPTWNKGDFFGDKFGARHAGSIAAENQ